MASQNVYFQGELAVSLLELKGSIAMLRPGIANPFGIKRMHIAQLALGVGINLQSLLPSQAAFAGSLCAFETQVCTDKACICDPRAATLTWAGRGTDVAMYLDLTQPQQSAVLIKILNFDLQVRADRSFVCWLLVSCHVALRR